MNDLRLTAKEGARHMDRKMDPTASPSPPTTSSSDDVQASRRPDCDQAPENKHKTSKMHVNKYAPSFSTSSRSSKVRHTDSDSSEGRKARSEPKRKAQEDAVKQVLSIQQTVKLRYVRAVDYRTYRLDDRSPCYDDSVSHCIPKIVKKLR